MKCRCGGETDVIDSRDGQHNTVRRRRECKVCGFRVTTYEAVGDENTLMLLRYRASRREKQKRWWLNKSPDERRAWKKREHLRSDARKEAKLTGEPVAQIYIRWGCE